MTYQLKRTTKTFLSCALSACVLAACSSSSKTAEEASGVPSRSADSKTGYQLRKYEERTLANGLKILFVPDPSLPYVSYSLLVKSGSSQDPEGQAGVSAFVAELLDNGTRKRSATQIAQELGQLGADFDASASMDYSVVTASALATQAEPLLNNLVELVMQPAFAEAEVERVRKELLAQVEKRVDNPDALSDAAFAQFMYGAHPYSRTVTGTLSTIKDIKKKNIIQHYLRHYRPNNATLAVVGKYTPELVSRIEQSFASWQAREVPPHKFAPVPETKGLSIRLIDKPGLVQTQIRIGHLGIKRKNEDFLALRVANTILGGAFASRLNSRIRKELGLTYTISSYFDAREDVGPFEISTFTKNATAGQTVSETLKLLAEFKDKGVTNDEVARAKGYLKGVFPTAIETPEKLAFNLLILRFYGIPDTYLTNYLRDIDRMSASDVNRVIKKYLDPQNIRVLAYSTASDVYPQLQPLVPSPGQVEIKKASEVQ